VSQARSTGPTQFSLVAAIITLQKNLI